MSGEIIIGSMMGIAGGLIGGMYGTYVGLGLLMQELPKQEGDEK